MTKKPTYRSVFYIFLNFSTVLQNAFYPKDGRYYSNSNAPVYNL